MKFNPDENSVYIKNVKDSNAREFISYLSAFCTNSFFKFHGRVCRELPETENLDSHM